MSKKFDKILKQFIREMKTQFPDSNELNVYYTYIKNTKNVSWIDAFMESVKDNGNDIISKNDKNLDKIEIIKMFNLKTYYDSCSKENKDIIWTYLQTLYFLGLSHKNYSSEFMGVIETIADKCEKSL